jgi:hypothetical protein
VLDKKKVPVAIKRLLEEVKEEKVIIGYNRCINKHSRSGDYKRAITKHSRS